MIWCDMKWFATLKLSSAILEVHPPKSSHHSWSNPHHHPSPASTGKCCDAARTAVFCAQKVSQCWLCDPCVALGPLATQMCKQCHSCMEVFTSFSCPILLSKQNMEKGRPKNHNWGTMEHSLEETQCMLLRLAKIYSNLVCGREPTQSQSLHQAPEAALWRSLPLLLRKCPPLETAPP